MDNQREQQIAMFGCTIEDMRRAVLFTDLTDPCSVNMYAMAILSDAQETMSHGNTEQTRQFINKAKYFISEASELIMESRLSSHSKPDVKVIETDDDAERFYTL